MTVDLSSRLVPAYTAANANQLVAVNSAGTGLTLTAAPSGGGGEPTAFNSVAVGTGDNDTSLVFGNVGSDEADDVINLDSLIATAMQEIIPTDRRIPELGDAGQIPAVDSTGNGLEFIDPPSADPPVIISRTPTSEELASVAAASIGGGTGLLIIANTQASNQRMASTIQIRAQIPGLLDADGNEISMSNVAANTISLVAGTIIRIFSGTQLAIISTPHEMLSDASVPRSALGARSFRTLFTDNPHATNRGGIKAGNQNGAAKDFNFDDQTLNISETEAEIILAVGLNGTESDPSSTHNSAGDIRISLGHTREIRDLQKAVTGGARYYFGNSTSYIGGSLTSSIVHGNTEVLHIAGILDISSGNLLQGLEFAARGDDRNSAILSECAYASRIFAIED